METKKILQALPTLSTDDKLKIVELALQLVNLEQQSLTSDEQKRLLAAAAKTAIDDYKEGSELLAFSEIEGEDFYDYIEEQP